MAARRWSGSGVAVVVALGAWLVPLATGAALRSTGPAAASFLATSNAGVRVNGRGQSVSVADNGHLITVKVPIASLRTGIALRDRHLRDKYLQAGQYPDIQLDVPWAVVKRPPPGGTVEADASGMLHLHGQTKPIHFHYKAHDQNGTIAVDGSLRVDIRQFGVQQPAFMGIKVNPVVDAQVHFEVMGR